MPKKIVHVITTLLNGGAQSSLYRLVVDDDINEHIVVVLRDKAMYGPMLEQAGVRVESLDLISALPSPRGLRKLYRIFKSTRPDIVQTWMYHSDLIGSLVARIAGCKRIIWCLHNSVLTRPAISRSALWSATLGAQLSKLLPTYIVSCSQSGVETHAEFGYKKSIMTVINNGYDTQVFAPNETVRNDLRQNLSIGENVFCFGVVARWSIEKDHNNLFDALAQLQRNHELNWCCVLVGEEMVEGNSKLQELAALHGIKANLKFCGSRTDMPSVMNAIDALVLPSFSEAFPNVLGEAMACGTPCIVTDVGDSGQIVKDTGWVVPIRNAQRLAEALWQCYQCSETDDWELKRVSARSRIEENFSIERNKQAFELLWNDFN